MIDSSDSFDASDQAAIPADRDSSIVESSSASADSLQTGSGQTGSRVGQRRQLRRSQISLLPLALIIIGIGVLLLITPHALIAASPFAIGLIAALIGLALTLRFLLNRREERGIGTFGITLLFTVFGVVGIETVSSTLLNTVQIAAIAIAAAGLAVWLTAALAITSARGSNIGTGMLGAALIIIGALALAVTSGLLDLSGLPLIDRLRDGSWVAYWPIAAIVLAILLLPLTVRRRN